MPAMPTGTQEIFKNPEGQPEKTQEEYNTSRFKSLDSQDHRADKANLSVQDGQSLNQKSKKNMNKTQQPFADKNEDTLSLVQKV